MDIPRPKGNKGHAEKLRELKREAQAYFPTTAQSITKTIHRIGMKGKFTVRSTTGGVNVWRIK